MTTDQEPAYMSFKDCGCIAMVVMANSKSAGRMVAQAVKHHERIERTTAEVVRATPFRCPDHARKQS